MSPVDAPMRHVHLGRLDYDRALGVQREAHEALRAGSGDEIVFSVEHPPTLTGGRRARDEDLLEPRVSLNARGVAVHRIQRGGEWTYHGPGQLVVYPIVDLRRRKLRVPCYVAGLRDAMAAEARGCWEEAGLGARVRDVERDDAPGCWVAVDDGPSMKVGSVGVHIRSGVTLHGLALNLAPDPWGFAWIVPCGLREDVTTSIGRILTAAGRPTPSLELEARGRRIAAALPGLWAARACASAE